MSDVKAGGWVASILGILLGGVLYSVVIAAAYKADPNFTLWPLKNQNHYAAKGESPYQNRQATPQDKRPPGNRVIQYNIDALHAYFQNTQYTDPRGYRENERADRDLRAQENMAFWAEWMVWVAGAGTAITLIGIVLVALTLKATRDATRAAAKAAEAAEDAVTVTREIGEKQVRAYLTIRQIKVEKFETDSLACVSVRIENTGQTPATHVKVKTHLPFTIATEEERRKMVFDRGYSRLVYAIPPGGKSEMFVRSEDPLGDDWVGRFKNGTGEQYLTVTASYNDVFDRRDHRTGYRGVLNADSLKKGKPFFQLCEAGNYST